MGVAMAYTRDQSLADDILQDVFVQVWKKREMFTGLKNFKAFLYVMTKNRCLTVFKEDRPGPGS